jgi:hypothetical protein
MKIEQLPTDTLNPYARCVRCALASIMLATLGACICIGGIAASLSELPMLGASMLVAAVALILPSVHFWKESDRYLRLAADEEHYERQALTGKQAIHEASGKTFDEMKAAKP